MKTQYRLPEEIYINRRRQEERASKTQGVLGAVILVCLLIYFGVIVSQVAEILA